jgi:uncharacterized protein YbjT (DUF2867 family)
LRKTAVIAGASGLVGGHCLQALLAADFDAVIALARKPLAISHPKLSTLALDAPLPDLTGGALFLALGTTIRKAGSQQAFRNVDLEMPLAIANRARRANVQQVAVVSSIGADSGSGNFYLKVKGELEDALRQLEFASTHIFQPSFLMGDRQEARSGEKIGIALAKGFQFLLIGGLSKYKPIQASAVGRAMVRVVERGEPGVHTYQWHEIHAFLTP